jgi:transposase InsO family protein
MKSITYTTKKIKRAVEFARKTDYSEAARRHGMTRQTIAKWDKRYDGTLKSLKHKSRAPHNCPRKHTESETELVMKIWKKFGKHGGDFVYGKLFRKYGFNRCRTTMYAILKEEGVVFKKQKRKHKNKTYYGAKIPGEKMQMDVKYVPKECLPEGHKKLYQYTIIDEATRKRYIEIYDEHCQWNTVKFVTNALKFFEFDIQKIQTDNGVEFTYKYLKTEKLSPFEKLARLKKIIHQLIKPATPRHNGRVERSHRTDQKHFYDFAKFKSFEDCQKKAKKWLKDYNNMPIRSFKYMTPNEILELHKQQQKPLSKDFIADFVRTQGLPRVA